MDSFHRKTGFAEMQATARVTLTGKVIKVTINVNRDTDNYPKRKVAGV